jgi:hypothetical protein
MAIVVCEIALSMSIPFSVLGRFNLQVEVWFEGWLEGRDGTIAWREGQNRPVKIAIPVKVFTSRYPSSGFDQSKVGVMKSGKIVAKSLNFLDGCLWEKGPNHRNASMSASGPYNIPNVWIDDVVFIPIIPLQAPCVVLECPK